MSRRYCITLLRNIFLLQTKRDLAEEWVCHRACSKKVVQVTQKLRSLPDAGAMSDEMEGKTNDFCVTLTKKRNDRSQHRRYLLKRRRVRLDEEKSIRDIL